MIDRPFRYRLLFVGVNHCPFGNHLCAAGRDAEALHQLFRGWGYWHDGNVLMVGADARSDRIREHLLETSRSRDLDLLLIYWSGHMLPREDGHYLMGKDAAASGSRLTGIIRLDELTLPMLASRAIRNRVLILDTCHAGSATRHLESLGDVVPARERLVVLAACAHDDIAVEDRQHGVFTKALYRELTASAEPRGRSTTRTIDLLACFQQAAQAANEEARQQPFFLVRGPGAHLRLPIIRQSRFHFEEAPADAA